MRRFYLVILMLLASPYVGAVYYDSGVGREVASCDDTDTAYTCISTLDRVNGGALSGFKWISENGDIIYASVSPVANSNSYSFVLDGENGTVKYPIEDVISGYASYTYRLGTVKFKELKFVLGNGVVYLSTRYTKPFAVATLSTTTKIACVLAPGTEAYPKYRCLKRVKEGTGQYLDGSPYLDYNPG